MDDALRIWPYELEALSLMRTPTVSLRRTRRGRKILRGSATGRASSGARPGRVR